MYYIIRETNFNSCNSEFELWECMQVHTPYESLDKAETLLITCNAARIGSTLSQVESTWQYEGIIYVILDSNKKYF